MRSRRPSRQVWLAIAAACAVIGCQSSSPPASGGQGSGKGDGPAADDLEAIAGRIGDLFESIMRQRHPPGTRNVKRAVFLKPHGCAQARFTIADELPDELRVGLFETPGAHDAWIRVSSDTIPSTSDFNNNTIGFAVKVLGVPGTKILPGEESFTTHDFVLQNHPVFFVDTAKDFLEFTEAIFAGQTNSYLEAHPTTDAILEMMAKPVSNVLGSRYFSTTTYRFGDRAHAKYSARPCTEPTTEPDPPTTEANYLRDRLERDLANGGACFELQVQLGVGDMPLDRATVEWDEATSPPQTVARIEIPAQDITRHQTSCENMSFTAWHALPAHRPVGSINEVRRIIYKRLADLRRSRNQVPIAEPEPFSQP